MSNTTEIVNQGIRVQMLKKGMKQADMQKAADFKQSYFSTRINGHRQWTLQDLDKIAKALDLQSALSLLSVADQANCIGTAA
ncbi:helix-turn-helix domain-containing protein [Bifidobacterium psychraerophilum]|jgi:hypothetical protein|uniref:helix-turn-helix domain-containing protein n=1 Tax=Bifidobacterium psychraerophilum TaxID=218140 RepID=UPI0023EFFAEC|nr:helix-turn-helix transcriptional regulator [Bifidobacterium psychraerophilum]MCI1660949.1 helix-turn-helix transcriptional regulator [Bifidobacterium psychraerophilum]MCI1805438.1 helix-turn-helix transcriptional regulator [Bifidobacterium psychraerophilum]MCI2177135.1 helix-turn-helix transcriptional regulator [Bifidobacterium psychraerophilum]MCI2182944.1 helix-turn-helix transcriptional regulator [Bifidobacterium psychraerophilum]